MSRLILVRHGQCAANERGHTLGRDDSPLTELGRRQAAAVAGALRDEASHGQAITRVIASPLSRAADTARAIADLHGLDVEIADGLTEMDIGEMEGMDWSDARSRFAAFLERWTGDDTATLAMPGGESMADVQSRAWPLVAPYLETDTDGVTHNFVTKALVCAALDLELNRWRQFETGLTSRTTFARVQGRTVLHTLNDSSHLTPDLRVH